MDLDHIGATRVSLHRRTHWGNLVNPHDTLEDDHESGGLTIAANPRADRLQHRLSRRSRILIRDIRSLGKRWSFCVEQDIASR